MSLFNSPQPQRYEYPILGVRGWEIKSNRLVAISDKSFVWQPGSNKARCNSYSNSCPCEMNILTAFQNHHCGFNASYGYNRYIINEGIVGVIAGAGKVQLHANGFRSEYAQVLGLLHPDPERNINFRSSFEKRLKIKLYQIQNKKYEQLAAYYRVPLFFEWEDLYEFASQYTTPIKVGRNQAIDIGKRTNIFYDLLSGF